jgi:hypothetical protein
MRAPGQVRLWCGHRDARDLGGERSMASTVPQPKGPSGAGAPSVTGRPGSNFPVGDPS